MGWPGNSTTPQAHAGPGEKINMPETVQPCQHQFDAQNSTRCLKCGVDYYETKHAEITGEVPASAGEVSVVPACKNCQAFQAWQADLGLLREKNKELERQLADRRIPWVAAMAAELFAHGNENTLEGGVDTARKIYTETERQLGATA
jgi:predicted nucleic-acid-binding Zn-ribbon protein